MSAEKRKRVITPEYIKGRNEYTKNRYDRLNIFVDKSEHIKERILNTGATSINEYVVSAILTSLDGDEAASDNKIDVSSLDGIEKLDNLLKNLD